MQTIHGNAKLAQSPQVWHFKTLNLLWAQSVGTGSCDMHKTLISSPLTSLHNVTASSK